MKILLLADGRSVHTERFRKGLRDAGAEVKLASLEPGEAVDYPIKRKSSLNSINYFLAGRQIRELTESFDPDIVNPHFVSGYGYTVAVSKVWKQKPVVLHGLGSDILVSPRKSFLHKWRVIKSLECATRVVVDSQYLSNEIKKLNPEIEPAVIPWGVEEAVLQIFLKKEGANIDSGRPRQVLIPRPHNPVYNNNFIIEALGDMVRKRRIVLTFPARGDDYKVFRRRCEREFPEGGINFYGFLPRREYIKFLGGFDIYLSAALSDSSPASLIEAMGAGLFPVVGDVPGVREWANDDSSILFDVKDKESLESGLRRLLSGKLNYRGILLKNHRKVRSEALFSENIRQTLSIMEAMIGRKV
ncbi:putative Glycosyl transferase group 1 [Candidatus Zixiibacteriota bacterium]|nr:putative Glycosyl transferase group 1 [candidate division Zixibacteria bacterium]